MKPTLVVNPADDELFSGFAHLLVEHGAGSTGALEERLRTIYPDATVHLRDLTGELVTIWYVYRDGHWQSRRPLEPGRAASASQR